jgi:signal peptidase I
MVPAVHPGDLLFIQPVSPEEVSLGDIVVYAREQALIVHRVVQRSNGSSEPYFITRGDRMLRNDPQVAASELLGRVVSVERGHCRVNLQTHSNSLLQAMCWILRRSGRATRLYLRASAVWRGLFSKEMAWQA